MRARDFLPRSFLDLLEEDDETTVGRGSNRLLGDPIRLGDAVGRR